MNVRQNIKITHKITSKSEYTKPLTRKIKLNQVEAMVRMKRKGIAQDARTI